LKLSIIITVFNLEDYISQCLDSLVEIEMYSNEYEIIVVDDGSEDASWSILTEYGNKFSQIRIFSQDNIGVGAARNLGISKATGDYLWIVDGDDLVISKKVADAVLYAIKNDADVLLFDYLPINEKGELEEWISFKSKFGNSAHLSGPEYYLLNCRHSYLWLHFFKRKIFTDNHLLFHPSIKMQDGELIPKILMHVKKVFYFKENLIKYRYRATSAVNNQEENARAHFYYSIVVAKIQLQELQDSLNPDSVMHKALKLKLKQLNQMLFTNLIKNDYSERINESFVALLKEHKLIPLKKITGFTPLMNLKFNLVRIILNINPYVGRMVYRKFLS